MQRPLSDPYRHGTSTKKPSSDSSTRPAAPTLLAPAAAATLLLLLLGRGAAGGAAGLALLGGLGRRLELLRQGAAGAEQLTAQQVGGAEGLSPSDLSKVRGSGKVRLPGYHPSPSSARNAASAGSSMRPALPRSSKLPAHTLSPHRVLRHVDRLVHVIQLLPAPHQQLLQLAGARLGVLLDQCRPLLLAVELCAGRGEVGGSMLLVQTPLKVLPTTAPWSTG
jgi:hypothetical protein